MTILNSYKQQINAYLDPNGKINSSLFWKGRVALYAILKAMKIEPDDEVILPAFTCVVVPNAIKYLGAKPVYVDIEPKTYNMDIRKIEHSISGKTKVIIAQNTFGLSPDLYAIIDIASKYNISVIEDCAHGFGGTYQGKPNGTIADASFFSTQWNKPYTTGIGGIAVSNDNTISQQLASLEKIAIKPSLKEVVSLKILYFLRKKLLTNRTYWTVLKLFRIASKYNLILGSSQGKELKSTDLPVRFFKSFTPLQAKRGIKELRAINLYMEHQKKIASLYNKVLSELGVSPPYEPDYATHTFLKYPLLVKDRHTFFLLARKSNIELGDWFLSPIHPVNDHFESWDYHWGSNPVAEKISKHIINLPTHQGITNNYANKICEFLKQNKNNICLD